MKDIFLIIFPILLLVALMFAILDYRSYKHDMFIRWANDCRKQGGIVEDYYPGRSECFINRKLVILDGWERY